MWSKVAETILKMMAVILPSLFSYQAGKKAVESDMKDMVIDDVKTRQEIEWNITNADDDIVKRMSERWTTRK